MTNNKIRMSGFTVVELMIVLAIMGIMMVAAMPSFVQFTRNSRIKGGAQTVVSALRTARSHAITKRKNCAVLFNMDASNVGYAVKIYWDPGTATDSHYPEGGSVTNWKALPKTIIMTPAQGTTLLNCVNIPFPNDTDTIIEPTIPAIVFKPTGGATSSRIIEISDINRNDTSYISILNTTGRVRTYR